MDIDETFFRCKGLVNALPTIAQHKSRKRHDNKWTHIKVKHQKLIMAPNKTGRCPLQKVLCFFL